MFSWIWRLLGRSAKPGDIYWADVPFEDGPGSKMRPCLVLRPRWNGYDVLKITSQDQSHRRDHVQIPTRAWDRNATKDSFLDLSDPLRVRTLDNRAGALDAATWKKVRKLHGV